MIIYTVTCKNLFALASFLIKEHIPFEFKPTRAYNHKHHRNGYGASVIEMTLEESTKHECLSLADFMFRLQEKYNTSFDLAIIGEFHY